MERAGRHFPNLKKFRRLFQYKQKQSAEILEVDSADLCRLEHGDTMPSVEILFKLAALYNTSPEVLYADYFREIQRQIAKRKELLVQATDNEKSKKI